MIRGRETRISLILWHCFQTVLNKCSSSVVMRRVIKSIKESKRKMDYGQNES